MNSLNSLGVQPGVPVLGAPYAPNHPNAEPPNPPPPAHHPLQPPTTPSLNPHPPPTPPQPCTTPSTRAPTSHHHFINLLSRFTVTFVTLVSVTPSLYHLLSPFIVTFVTFYSVPPTFYNPLQSPLSPFIPSHHHFVTFLSPLSPVVPSQHYFITFYHLLSSASPPPPPLHPSIPPPLHPSTLPLPQPSTHRLCTPHPRLTPPPQPPSIHPSTPPTSASTALLPLSTLPPPCNMQDCALSPQSISSMFTSTHGILPRALSGTVCRSAGLVDTGSCKDLVHSAELDRRCAQTQQPGHCRRHELGAQTAPPQRRPRFSSS